MRIHSLVESLQYRFRASGLDNAKRAAEELLAHALECNPLEIYTHTANKGRGIDRAAARKLEPLAERIEAGEPLQYVIGYTDFRGVHIRCDRRALIPRPETELLVEEVLRSNIWNRTPVRIIDVGTGSGCIALALAQQGPASILKAVDISPSALELAKENERRSGKEGVLWMENNLLERFTPAGAEAVVANLPYIASSTWRKLPHQVRDYEPRSALESGPAGMELISGLAEQARHILVPGGKLFLEFGFDQGLSVFNCLKKRGYTAICIRRDLAGHNRIAAAVSP